MSEQGATGSGPWTKVALASISINAALIAGFAILPGRDVSPTPADTPTRAELLRDPDVMREVVAELAAESRGTFDSHNDPQVGRVQFADFEGAYAGRPLVTNAIGAFGMPWALSLPRAPFTGRTSWVILASLGSAGVAELTGW